MKYIIMADASPEVGKRIEANPAEIMDFTGKWQAHNPIAIYASLTKRRLTVILDAAALSRVTVKTAHTATW